MKGDEVWANVTGIWQKAQPPREQVLEERYSAYDSMRDAACAATIHTCGRGKIVAIYGPLGTIYAINHAAPLRQFIRRLVEKVFTPVVRVEGPPVLEVALRRNGRILAHLLNAAGMQVAADYAAIDFIPPVGPVRVEVRLERLPVRARLEPGGRPVRGEQRGGAWVATIPRVDIHEILALEF